MALAAKQFGSAKANPSLVLRHIGASPVDLSDDAPAPNKPAAAAVQLKVFQPDEPTADAEQTRQLGQHLVQWQARLEEQQSTFDEERLHWILQCDMDYELLEEKTQSVNHRLRQVKSLERQLLQLQIDVIDGQTALRPVADTLCQEGFADSTDAEKIAALEDLRFEISERFDYLIKRWDQFRATEATA